VVRIGTFDSIGIQCQHRRHEKRRFLSCVKDPGDVCEPFLFITAVIKSSFFGGVASRNQVTSSQS